MNYTDRLIESMMHESYTSKAAQTSADQAAAEKAYKDELVNGPTKQVIYANGFAGQKRVGSLDLDNLHKAYDKFYEDNNLLGLFADDGKLSQRNCYGTIKDLNKKEPAVKALYDLWGLQFGNNNGLVFYSNKLAQQSSQQQAMQQKQEIATGLKEKIIDLPEYKEVVDKLTKLDSSFNPTVLVTVVNDYSWVKDNNFISIIIRGDSADKLEYYIDYRKDILPYEINVVKNNIMYSYHQGDFAGANTVDEKQDKIISSIKIDLNKMNKFYALATYLNEVTKSITQHPEAKDLLDIYSSEYRAEALCYYEPTEQKYYKVYKCKYGSEFFDQKDSSLLVIEDIDNPKDKAHILSEDAQIVAACKCYHTTYSSMSYREESYYNFWNDGSSDSILDKLGIEHTPKEGGPCAVDIKVGNIRDLLENDKLLNYFDKYSHYSYECDSGD